MSYNISQWMTKELKDFRVKIEALGMVRDYLDEPTIDLKTDMLLFTGRSEGFELAGKRADGYLAVGKIENWGEASGTMQGFLSEKVFPHSTGTLIAVCVWERGDTITRLTVKDGAVTEEQVKL